MCYAKPGPRCTSHAKAALSKAHDRYRDDPSESNFSSWREASRVYDGTDGGQAELRQAIQRTHEAPVSPVQLLERDTLKARLEVGLREHQQALSAYHDLQKSKSSEVSIPLPSSMAMILEDADNIECLDYSSDSDDEWTTLSKMADPEVARQNCMSATSAVAEYAEVNGLSTDEESVLSIEMVFEKGVHWANIVVDENNTETVIDFTARQFDTSAPFPLVMPKEKWVSWVNKSILDKFGDKPARQITIHDQ